MSDSPESVVREFFAAWADSQPDQLGSFFHDAAVWVDAPQGVRRGADAITAELMAVFEIDADRRIRQWREAYDLKSVMDQIKAASRARPLRRNPH